MKNNFVKELNVSDISKNNGVELAEHEVCCVCGKPCGPTIKDKSGKCDPPPKIYHWECAYKVCKEARDFVLRGR